MASQFNGFHHFFVIFIHFVQLIVTRRSCVIYVKKDNDSNIYIGFDYTTYTDYMDLTICCLRKAVQFIHSLRQQQGAVSI